MRKQQCAAEYTARQKKRKLIKANWVLYLFLVPAFVYFGIFAYAPMYGVQIAFKNFIPSKGIWGSEWEGLTYFTMFFRSPKFWDYVRNTVYLSLYSLIAGFPVPIILALILNDIRNSKLKRISQTLTYMPHFISWVVFGGIVITLLSGDGGLFNQILMKLGIISQPVVFMAQPRYFWAIAILSNLVKELGWSTILYTAAISGVDQELYEAADLDGAGRLQKMRYVTLPCIKGTIVIMVIFAVAGIMNNNFDQLYVLQNSFNLERSEVIDTYIYKVGLQQLQFGMAAAVNIFKSILAIILLTTANFVSNKLTDSGLF